MSDHLRVNPILCDAYGHCAELLPELIQLDEWGYPIVDDRAIPPELKTEALRAVSSCPRLALLLEHRRNEDRDRYAPSTTRREAPAVPTLEGPTATSRLSNSRATHRPTGTSSSKR